MKRRLLLPATILVLPAILLLVFSWNGRSDGPIAERDDDAKPTASDPGSTLAGTRAQRALEDAVFVEEELSDELKELADADVKVVPSRRLEPQNFSGQELENIPAGVSRVDEVLFESVRAEGNNGMRRSRVLKTDFHYPLLQTVEVLKTDPTTGEEEVVGYHSMVADHALVQLDLSRTPENWRNAFAARGFEVRRQVSADGLFTVGFDVEHADPVSTAVATLEKEADWVEYAEPDFVIAARDDEAPIPSDPSFQQLWGLDEINAVEAWTEQTKRQEARSEEPAPGRASWFDDNGEEHHVIVAVLDTGINLDHLDLYENLWVNPREEENLHDDSGNGFVDDIHGASMVFNDGWPMDFHGHGSHVAGTIGAIGDNSKGVVGVAWDVRLMGVQILGAGGGGTLSDGVRGIDYAWQNGAHILNNSWGFDHYGRSMSGLPTRTMGRAIERVRDAGAIFVTAAGNDNEDVDLMPSYPADFQEMGDNVVNVGSIDQTGNRSFFSNYGEENVHVYAPGSNIVSTYLGFDEYTMMSGTSMAAPHISGMFALLKAEFPDDPYNVLIQRLLQRSYESVRLTGLGVNGRQADLSNSLAPGPLIYSQLQDREFSHGETVTFSVEVTGEGTPSYTWLHDGEEIPGETGSELDLGSVDHADLGRYRVEVSTAYGSSASEAELRERPGLHAIAAALGASDLRWTTSDHAPWEVIDEGSEGVRSGEINHHQSTELRTTVTGPGTLEFSWHVSSEERFDIARFIVGSEVKEDVSGESGWISRTYEIPHGTHDLVWIYAKDGSDPEPDPDGEEGSPPEDLVRLADVSYDSDFPVIVDQTEDIELQSGTSAMLSFEATGAGSLTYSWYKNGEPLLGENTPALSLNNPNAEDAGTYVGLVSNVHGIAETKPITVKVHGEARAPEITRHPRSFIGFAGETLQLSADWEGTQPSNAQWYRNDEPLEGATADELMISILNESDAGVYTLVVENGAGEAATRAASVEVHPAQIHFSDWKDLQETLAKEERAGKTLSPLLQFALGSDVSGGEQEALPTFSLVPDLQVGVAGNDGRETAPSDEKFPALEFDIPVNAAGVNYVLEASSDMKKWDEVESLMEPLGEPNGVLQRVRLREVEPVDDAPRRFLRLRVEVDEQ